MSKDFKALIVDEDPSGNFISSIQKRRVADLPKGDLTVRVEYSSLNYKDALSATGNKGVTRQYPHTPGIDATGVVEDSSHSDFPIGTEVIVSGYDLGMNTAGGFGEYIRVPVGWTVKRPERLSAREAMIIGTAGLTAGLCVKALKEKSTISGMKALVSGATGGVGCMAVKLLSHLDADVTAITGKKDATNFLERLGANEIISRTKFLESVSGPIAKGFWNIAVDVAGGNILSSILASMRYGGTVACCGLVDDSSFKGSVFPFILRGNRLIGIDSVEIPIQDKAEIWNSFANEWRVSELEDMCKPVKLDGIIAEIDKILDGNQIGRVLLEM